ncbi:MAG TPA: circularly permuted type 2 ATP-grasp protein [Solirubrobacteraceae bacterium]|nr:circularly permuted type 2 ATP-grasp protein [Solirubrobacteraceae bacterium]
MTGTLPSSSPEYRPLAGCYDEMLDDSGRPRRHWEQLAGAFAELGLDELHRRRGEAARLLDQDGVVYNAYGETASPGRRWRLDPLPTVLSSSEWGTIERGVIERAELLGLVLEDLYGPRELLRRRLLPPEIVFAHPGFLRSCDGVRLPGTQQLFSYAADLGRDAAGRTVVLADHAQAPSGAGYALENRTVISRVLPSMYRDAHVHRLAPFFRSLRAALQEVAPPGVDDPRIVVLTPGPLNETAFEHAVLASTLGYPLVQGRDLTVRGDRVWMRSVGQFEPVDVILRRVDASYCDPLELRPDSQLGVPGLLEMARVGRVSVVNPLGASVLENPALMAFLPAVGRHFLGAAPQLDSVETWWCGEPDSLRHVLARLDSVVVRPISRDRGPSIRGFELSGGQLAELRRAIERSPRDWVGQVALPMASTPVLVDGRLDSRRSILRTFAIARRDTFAVMPGGLTRVQADPDSVALSNHAGAISKDTWVLASEPETLGAFWLQGGPAVEGIDPMASIPSRAAENLWWLGRYAERAESLTRLLRTVIDRTNEFGGATNPAGAASLDALASALAWIGGTDSTLVQPLRAMLDNAYAVRDQLSRDTWLVIGPLERVLADLDIPLGDPQRHSQAALQQVIQSLLALGGLGIESMVRDLGWRFMDAGRRLERSLQLLSLLRSTVPIARGTAADSLLLESVLGAAESIITYRFRYRSHAQLETVLELLLRDPGNPRSLAYQLERLTEDLDALPLGSPIRLREEQRLVLEAHTRLRLADLPALVREDEDGRRPELDSLLASLAELLLGAGDAVDATHFVHTTPTFSLLGPAGAEPAIGRAT